LERDSERFRKLFNNPRPGKDGLKNATAIPLDVDEDEFVALLDFFYNGYVDTP
jgi:hypothetical protein